MLMHACWGSNFNLGYADVLILTQAYVHPAESASFPLFERFLVEIMAKRIQATLVSSRLSQSARFVEDDDFEHQRLIEVAPPSYAWDDGELFLHPVSESYRNRQLYLQSYKFTREETLAEKLRSSLSKFKKGPDCTHLSHLPLTTTAANGVRLECFKDCWFPLGKVWNVQGFFYLSLERVHSRSVFCIEEQSSCLVKVVCFHRYMWE
ncbi:hypothetical protein GOP47_0007120 [Adiantum capillus-veneris]|uniref:Uncharacterized protein n=1 Tax=Adiantum capillus-veneris TaxID=13818 RepID=A0A9D4V026_ADICA|nr:hypothetical protein GOP47_0007120 [Adiantum capillus-veneris]